MSEREYRMLKVGEIIRKGDEYSRIGESGIFTPIPQEWDGVELQVRKSIKIRRPIKGGKGL